MSALARWKWPLLLSLLAGAAALALWGDKRPAGLAQPSREADTTRVLRPLPRPAAGPAAAAVSAAAPATLALLLPRTSRPAPAGNPFGVVADPLPPLARVVVAPPPPVPPPPPERPPYAYQGKQQVGGRWQVFLVHDEQVHIVQAGSTLDRRWRIESIQPPTLAVTDLVSQQRFSIPIGESP